ncbi:MAG TPA: SGNH/GDSL hydrolase family protein [Pyrinomonadaceae bacterium]|jgi:hypothetical protein|nr:SGNH/GDSL hydrolase family protein [Pyrinomonadaceae bacterium]
MQVPTVAGSDSDVPVELENGSRTLPAGKRWLYRIIAILIGIVLSVFALELILRIAGWPAPGFYVAGRGPIVLRKPGLLGGAYPPNANGRLKNYEYDVSWVVNEDGFRERSASVRVDKEWRIGILGDSFAAGFGVEQPARFGDIWGVRLHQQNPNITTWNLATPNCGTVCEAEILETYAQRYSLDEILLVFYGGNDLQDNLDDYRGLNGAGLNDQSPGTYRVWLREHSRLASFVWVNAFRAFATVRPPGVYSEKKLQSDWPTTALALDRFKKAVGERRLTVLYVPSLPEWEDESWRELSKYPDVEADGRILVKNALQKWAADNKVGFLDSTSWLSGCKTRKDCVYPVDGHWTPLAHLMTGDELTQYLVPAAK